MPFASGTYSLPSGNPVVTNTVISSTWANNTLSDIATALSTCVLKDGTQTITANIPMATHKLTQLSAGASSGDSIRYEQVFTTTALTDGATVDWIASNAPVATWTIGGNRTLNAPSGLKSGGTYKLVVTQDGTGGRTITWNAVFLAQGGGTMPQPETTAASITVFTFTSPDGTNLICEQCMPFIDSNYFVRGSADPSKKWRVEVDGFTSATTNVFTPPNQNLSLSSITAKGDIWSASASGAMATTAIGTNGQVLQADSASTGGVKWATTPLTFLAGGSITAGAATLDVIMTGSTFTSFAHKRVIVDSVPVTDGVALLLRVSTNGGTSFDSTASDYSDVLQLHDDNGTSVVQNNAAGGGATALSLSYAANVGNGATEGIHSELIIPHTTSTTRWPNMYVSSCWISSDVTPRATEGEGSGARRAAQDTDAIRILWSTGSFSSGGSYSVWGFN